MRETIIKITCDRCGAPALISFGVLAGYFSGAIGQESDVRGVDLCVNCAERALRLIINEQTSSFEETHRLMELVLSKEK